MKTNSKMIVIAWAERLDNAADFAKRIDAPFYGIYCPVLKENFPITVPLRYLLQTLKTWRILRIQKPAIVHVTNPPIFAVLNVFLYCKLFHAKYILCTHPPALYSQKWSWTVPFLRLLARNALVNTLDQERFKNLFASWGSKALVLTKRPRPYTPRTNTSKLDCKYPIVVVNTFAPDEPLEPVLAAAELLPDVHFFILGNTALANPRMISGSPENVTFTGWLSHDDYWECLGRSRAVMTLTTYPHSLLAGGTDGMAMAKPLILSEQPALRRHFNKGTVFVANTSESIVNGIRQLQQQEDRLRQEIDDLRIEKSREWERNFEKLQSLIGQI